MNITQPTMETEPNNTETHDHPNSFMALETFIQEIMFEAVSNLADFEEGDLDNYIEMNTYNGYLDINENILTNPQFIMDVQDRVYQWFYNNFGEMPQVRQLFTSNGLIKLFVYMWGSENKGLLVEHYERTHQGRTNGN